MSVANSAAPPLRTGPPVDVRPPRRSELRACRMFLPEAFDGGHMPDLLLAVQNHPLRFAGAAAYRQSASAGAVGWNVMLHVPPAHRRRGVGSRLVAELIELARHCRIRSLTAKHDVDAESVAGLFLQKLGFRFSGRESRGEVELKRYLDVFAPIHDRLLQRGKIPASARVVVLRDAPRAAVLRFFAAHRGASAEDAQMLWPSQWDRPSTRDASMVLMRGEHVLGLFIGESSGSRLVGHYRVIGPTERYGWANLLLCAEGARHHYDQGVRQVEFVTTERTGDTKSMTNLYGSTLLRSLDHYVLTMPATATSGATGGSKSA